MLATPRAIEMLREAVAGGSLCIPSTMPYGATEFTAEMRADPLIRRSGTTIRGWLSRMRLQSLEAGRWRHIAGWRKRLVDNRADRQLAYSLLLSRGRMSATATKTELTVLKQLWSVDRASAREVHDASARIQAGAILPPARFSPAWRRRSWCGVQKSMASQSTQPPDPRSGASAIARELTRSVRHQGALPASMFADSPHLSEEDMAELDMS